MAMYAGDLIPPCIVITGGYLRGWRVDKRRDAIEVTTHHDVAPVFIDGGLTASLEIEVYATADYPSVDVARAWLIEESVTAHVDSALMVRQRWEFESMPDDELNALLGMPTAKKVEAPEVIRRKIRAMDLG